MSSFEMICPTCGHQALVQGPVGTRPQARCSVCQEEMRRVFTPPLYNFGYREGHYATQEEANIAKFQFTHL